MPSPQAAEWVIEVRRDGEDGWELSILMSDNRPRSLDWCMDVWRKFKGRRARKLAHPSNYRLRNTRTDDILMGMVL